MEIRSWPMRSLGLRLISRQKPNVGIHRAKPTEFFLLPSWYFFFSFPSPKFDLAQDLEPMVLRSRRWSARSSFLPLENYFHPASSILRQLCFISRGGFPIVAFQFRWKTSSHRGSTSLFLSISFFPLVRTQAKCISSAHQANPCECCNPFNPAVTSRINEQQGLLSFLGYYLREWLPPSDSETDFFSSPSTSALLTEEKINPFEARERFLYGSYSEGIFMSVHGLCGPGCAATSLWDPKTSGATVHRVSDGVLYFAYHSSILI